MFSAGVKHAGSPVMLIRTNLLLLSDGSGEARCRFQVDATSVISVQGCLTTRLGLILADQRVQKDREYKE